MNITSQKAIIREMDADELEAHAKKYFAKCQDVGLDSNEHADFKYLKSQYKALTGVELPFINHIKFVS